MRQRFPTQELSERLLRNGGKLPGDRLGFLPNTRISPLPPQSPETPLDELMRRLTDLYAKVPSINMRPPSHVKPPFRAVQWAYSAALMVDSSNPIDNAVILLNGNDAVPTGMNGVLAYVDVTLTTFDRGTGTTGPDYYDYTGSGANPSRWTINRNGSALPGFGQRLARASVGGQIVNAGGAGFIDTWLDQPNPCFTVCSAILVPSDVLTLSVTVPMAVPAEAVVTILGWIYPQESSGDGIKGTLADRWKTLADQA